MQTAAHLISVLSVINLTDMTLSLVILISSSLGAVINSDCVMGINVSLWFPSWQSIRSLTGAAATAGSTNKQMILNVNLKSYNCLPFLLLSPSSSTSVDNLRECTTLLSGLCGSPLGSHFSWPYRSFWVKEGNLILIVSD